MLTTMNAGAIAVVSMALTQPGSTPPMERPIPTPMPRDAEPRPAARDLAWVRASIETPGGPLPFVMSVRPGHNTITVVNGEERIHLEMPRGEHVPEISFEGYGSTLTFAPQGGEWATPRRGGVKRLPVTYTPIGGPHQRFEPMPWAGGEETGDFSGRWSVRFADDDDAAVGVFEVNDDAIATGTFMTATGDYRYLEGRVDGALMRLSTFDGAHAFLFRARLGEDGTITGDFWSGDWYHTAWTATRDPHASLPDAFETTTWTGEGLDTLELPDLEDGTRSLDELISDGPVILDLFGSWCPNCADAADLLAEYQDRYGERGLRIVGLAFEHGDDLARNRERVAKHQRHHGAKWPVLIAGSSDKKKASEAFPALDRVRAYPTLVFLKDGEALAVHTGFSGPATGEAYERMRLHFERLIDRMLED